MRRLWIMLVVIALIPHSRANAGDWPGWRGPTGMGHTDEKDLPLEWDGKTNKNIIWKAAIPGTYPKIALFSSPGHSSPIVWRDRVFITTAIWPADANQDEWKRTIAEHHVLCFQTSDGKQLWDVTIPAGKIMSDNIFHGYAVPTPVTDGKHVFALFGSGVLVCLDFEGKIVWREELPRLKDVDPGICSSPILYEDTVIVPSITDAGLRALEKATGKLKWEQKSRDKNRMATPVLLHIQDKLQMIHFAGGMQGLDPATGDVIWSCRAPTSQSSPTFGQGLIFGDAGRGGKNGVAIDPTSKGDVSKTHVKWEVTDNPGAAASSAVISGNFIYRVSDPSRILCRNLTTGELIYDERVMKISPSASPIATPDGRIYFASAGTSYVVKAGPTYELLATNSLESGNSQNYSTPAVADGRLYIKGRFYLWCVGTKKGE